MRAGILRRIQKLEGKAPREEDGRPGLPDWMIAGLAEQGIPCDESGYPDWAVVNRIRDEVRIAAELPAHVPSEATDDSRNPPDKIALRFD
jgi:hypothetical protein